MNFNINFNIFLNKYLVYPLVKMKKDFDPTLSVILQMKLWNCDKS